MSLLIKIHLVEPVKKEYWLKASLIIAVERANSNSLITQVSTTLMTETGAVVLNCLDSPEAIVKDVNNALLALPWGKN